MYVVRDKKTKRIIHINPAPLSQQLEGTAVYYKFNPKTMEIGKTDLTVLPEHFAIDERQNIRELTLEEQIKEGLISPDAEHKIVDGQLVEKTISEKIKEGLITLAPIEKVIGSGAEERIVLKTPSELLAEKQLELGPNQKIVGEGPDEKIVLKSLEEQVSEGLIVLNPNQRIENDQIVTYTNEEMVDKGLIDFNEYKKRKTDDFSNLSFKLREDLIPTYKLVNVGLGMYSEAETNSIKATTQAFRDEFYRLKTQIEGATTVDEVKAIKENYPRVMINPGS
ncbi:MAG TPA: hypothetical protein VHY08_13180 [Bacillota bacterium]|nr:hypothetical protein [Bacillota bacterium]